MFIISSYVMLDALIVKVGKHNHMGGNFDPSTYEWVYLGYPLSLTGQIGKLKRNLA